MITLLSNSHYQGQRESPNHCHRSASTKAAPHQCTATLETCLSYLVFRWTQIEILECGSNIFRESWPKNILVCSELVPRLPNNGVDDVQPRDFVLRLALQRARQFCVRQGHQEVTSPSEPHRKSALGLKHSSTFQPVVLHAQASMNTAFSGNMYCLSDN